MNNLSIIFSDPQFYFTAIRMTTPILYAALACYVLAKGGIDPIAVEGMMLISALIGPLVGSVTKSALIGVLCSALTGAFLSALYVIITRKMQTNEILTGVAYNTFAQGITVAILFFLTGEKGSTQSIRTPMAPQINFAGHNLLTKIIANHNILTYLAILLCMIIYILFFKTPKGLEIRAVGEKPGAASSVGISTFKISILTSIIGGSIVGLGGAFMSMAYVNGFTRGMIAGRGFIGMAANGMGGGSIIGLLLSSFLFGISDALAIRLQLFNLPQRLVQTIPYIITILGITIYSYYRKREKENKRG